MKKLFKKIKFVNKRKGMYLPVILVSATLFIAMATAIIALSLSNLKIAALHNKKITSMSIAEAGINYYMWHLSHDNTDYCDGNACEGETPYGPYAHDYKDQSGRSLGTFELYITPPSGDSSITTVKSIGKVNGESPRRTIIAQIGMPSFTRYTLLVNGTQLWVGPTEKIQGTVHANDSGLYNDGEITGDASSTEEEYDGWFGTQPGVSGPGTFGGSKLFPVPRIDMEQLNVDILSLRNNAKLNGEGDYYDNSGDDGYHIVLEDSDYKVFIVNNYRSNRNRSDHLSILGETLLGTYPYPSEGVIFLEDNAWIDGKINNQKVTLVAADPDAKDPERRIIIPNSIKYTNYDGSDKIGLITQTDILLTRQAPDSIEIDAAMIAKDGEIKIAEYCEPNLTCLDDQKSKIKVYGSMAHNTGLIWTHDYDGKWSGYATTETIIDENNILNPPPKFPLTGTYAILSWREE